MSTNDIIMLVTILAYLVAMVTVGIRFSNKNKNVSDFYLGGRNLGPIVTAMSAEASDMSSWLLMGLPGVAYLSGVAEASWTAIGLAIGTYVNWLIVAKKLRNYSQICNNSITIPEFFSNRYRDNSRVIMGISAVIILVFFVPYTASGFAACGKLFSSLFGIDYHLAMIISAIIIMCYTSIGGFLAASTTDFVQSIVMTIALVSIVIFGVNAAGGLDAVAANAESLAGYLSFDKLHDAVTGGTSDYGALKIVSTLAWGLGYFGMPHILLRFMAIQDGNKIKISRRIATVWVVISLAVAIFIGIIGNAATKAGVLPLLEGADSETVVIQFASALTKLSAVGAILAGIIISGIFASTMSTSDSQLLAASSSVSEDLFRGVFKRNFSEKASMLTARITLVLIAAIGVVIAWNKDSSVFRIVSFAWAGFGATFGPSMLAALFWKRSNKYGIIAGMLAGGITVFVWKYCISPLGGVWNIYELLPAFIVATLFIVVVSLLTKAPEDEITEEFEKVKAIK
ncbi:MAG: sodium/proline symporter PutP [Ruminococcus sp.]|nr:sodium/proline symporter PutP [Ruminococcus sp.]